MKDNWDKFEILGKVIGVILIPIAISYFGYQYNKSLQQNEIKLKYIEIATSILRDEPNSETREIRSWAIDVLSEYSLVEFDNKALEELSETALPKANYAINPDGTPMLNPDSRKVKLPSHKKGLTN